MLILVPRIAITIEKRYSTTNHLKLPSYCLINTHRAFLGDVEPFAVHY